MAQDLIRYDLLVQDALKSVVRKVLTDAAAHGLPGDHHFYISFRTEDPNVRISQRLREKYPVEMTIVLQHQFWDLAVTEHAFEVGLSFSGIPERLLVPFDALTGFFDPSVQFGLKFELSGSEPADNDEEEDEDLAGKGALPVMLSPGAARNGEQDTKATPEAPAKGKARDKADSAAEKAGKDAAEDAKDGAGAEVVSLDAFRKKT
jgi:hypothetical protein